MNSRFSGSLADYEQLWTTELNEHVIRITFARPLLDVPMYIITSPDLDLIVIIEDADLSFEIKRRMLDRGVRTVQCCVLRIAGTPGEKWPEESGSEEAGVRGTKVADFKPLWTSSVNNYVLWVKYCRGSPDVPRYAIVRRQGDIKVRFADGALFFEVLRRMLEVGVETIEYCTFESEIEWYEWKKLSSERSDRDA